MNSAFTGPPPPPRNGFLGPVANAEPFKPKNGSRPCVKMRIIGQNTIGGSSLLRAATTGYFPTPVDDLMENNRLGGPQFVPPGPPPTRMGMARPMGPFPLYPPPPPATQTDMFGGRQETHSLSFAKFDVDVAVGMWNGGMRTMSGYSPQAYRDSDLVILAFNVISRRSFEELPRYLAEAVSAIPNGKRVILGLKTDLREKASLVAQVSARGEPVISKEEAEAFARKLGLPYVEVSARNDADGARVVVQAFAEFALLNKPVKNSIPRMSFEFIRERATEICIAMQSAELPALLTLALIDEACPEADMVPMHFKWDLITAVKHKQH